MEDNTQPVPPEKPEIKDAEIVEPVAKKAQRRRSSVISKLPDSIRMELEKILLENSAKAAKDWMMKNHIAEFPEVANLSVTSYHLYRSTNKKRMEEENALTTQLATPDPQVQGVINAITDPAISLDDKRKALTALFNSCEARKQLLATKQTGFLDPMIEGLILANTKEMRVIIEKVALLNEQLSKDSERDFLGELEQFYKVIIAAVSNSYRLINGNSKYQEFLNLLDENLQTTLKNYRVSRDAINAQTK